ncbi:MAG: DUF420 domain-containing protein [Pirellulaceae bacterium]
MSEEFVRQFPHINASLNLLSTILLIVGYRQIRRGNERQHKQTMLACFGVSVLFLVCYLVYHSYHLTTKFPDYPPAVVRYIYLSILATHVILAAAVPFLAVATIYLGLRNKRTAHRRIAKFTFPIWLYVSITGVVVYLMLYQLFPAQGG